MDDILINILNWIGQGPTNPFGDLVKDPSEYNSSLYDAAVALHNTAVKPLTAVILSIVLIMMLATASTRIDGDRELGVRIISGILLKAILVIVFASNALLILQAIDEVSTTVATSALDADIGGSTQSMQLGDQLSDGIKDMGTTDKLGLLVLVAVPFFISEIVGVLALVLIFVRFIQLYLLTVFASLPIAFIAYEETKSMGIGYLKRYASTALTGAVMLIALKLYGALIGGWMTTNIKITDASEVTPFLFDNFGSLLVAPLLLAFVLFGATQISKALVGDA